MMRGATGGGNDGVKHDTTDTWLRALVPPEKGKRLVNKNAREPGLVLRTVSTGAATWSACAVTADRKHIRPKLGT